MAITLADFTKIWASTSPLTPYSFSDANYQQGWNFVGATPPARQMWDSIQKLNDEKTQWLNDNKLSLSGGTMTGGITLADGGNPLSTAGGTLTGAVVGNPLTLTADDGNGNSADLVLNSNGSATWDSKEIERINGKTNDYIEFSSGLKLCWGTVTTKSDGTGASVDFPVEFTNNPCVECTAGSLSNNPSVYGIQVKNLSTTGCNVFMANGSSWAAGTVRWFAIGF